MITKAWFLFLMCWKWASIVTPIEEVIILGPFSKMHEESFFPYKKKEQTLLRMKFPKAVRLSSLPPCHFASHLSVSLYELKKKAFEMRGSCFKAL